MPVRGEYPLSNAGLIGVAADGADLSYGPVQWLGVWDTRPDEAPWDVPLHRSLDPKPAPGGVTLRWAWARRGDPASSVPPPYPGPVLSGSVALRLIVAGIDVSPAGEGWRTLPTWPGSWTSGADTTEAYNRAWILALQTASRGQRGGLAWRNNADGLQLLSRHLARPVLDLLAYAGAPWCEADLGELAGGTRYAAAWLQQVWSRTNGVDPIGSASWVVPYAVVPGPARAPVHRRAWHCAYPIASTEIAAEANLYDEDATAAAKSARVGIASPIAGRWSVHARHNGLAGADPMFVGCELRGAGPIERAHFALGIADQDEGVILERCHGGAATLVCGAVGAAVVDGALVHVSVVADGGAG